MVNNWRAAVNAVLADGEWHTCQELFAPIEKQILAHVATRHAVRQRRDNAIRLSDIDTGRFRYFTAWLARQRLEFERRGPRRRIDRTTIVRLCVAASVNPPHRLRTAKFEVFSGTWSHWPLADALSWRLQWKGITLEVAFDELRHLCVNTPGLFATGVLIGSHPARPRGWDFPPYEPYATPNRVPHNTPNLGRVPAEDWEDLEPVTDQEAHPTNRLRYKSAKLEAWDHIELDKTTLVNTWLELMGRPESDVECRVRDWMTNYRDREGRYPNMTAAEREFRGEKNQPAIRAAHRRVTRNRGRGRPRGS
jgi:hypothetical protein